MALMFLWIAMAFPGFLCCGSDMGFVWTPIVLDSYGFLWFLMVSLSRRAIWKHYGKHYNKIKTSYQTSSPHHYHPQHHMGGGVASTRSAKSTMGIYYTIIYISVCNNIYIYIYIKMCVYIYKAHLTISMFLSVYRLDIPYTYRYILYIHVYI